MNASDNTHQSTYKKGVSVEDGRRNRQDTAVQIRKNKRQESLAKRRNMRKENAEANSSAGDGTAPSSSKKSPVFGDLPCTLENLPKFAEAAKTTDNALVQ